MKHLQEGCGKLTYTVVLYQTSLKIFTPSIWSFICWHCIIILVKQAWGLKCVLSLQRWWQVKKSLLPCCPFDVSNIILLDYIPESLHGKTKTNHYVMVTRFCFFSIFLKFKAGLHWWCVYNPILSFKDQTDSLYLHWKADVSVSVTLFFLAWPHWCTQQFRSNNNCNIGTSF